MGKNDLDEGLPEADAEKSLGGFTGFVSGYLGKIFGVVGFIIGLICKIIYIILFKIVPFIVFYFGIPLFILGAIMAVIFTGGHIFFTIVFLGGTYIYFKKIIKSVYKLPDPNKKNITNNISSQISNAASSFNGSNEKTETKIKF